MSRSHLTPTPIVDKNGVSSTRLMKPSASKPSVAAIPQVTSAPSIIEGSPEQLMQIMFGDRRGDDEYYAINLMHENDMTTVPFAVRLLTTGTPTGRAFAQNELRGSLESIMESHSEHDNDDDWWNRNHIAWSPFAKQDMVLAWCAGNVYEEHQGEERQIDVHSLIKSARTLDAIFEPRLRRVDRSGDTGYWRGLCAIALTELGRGGIPRADMGEARIFADWAGAHEDISRIISTADERGTLDYYNLREVLMAQDGITPSMREGAL